MKIRKKPIIVDAWKIDIVEMQYNGSMPTWVYRAWKEDKRIGFSSDGNDMILLIKTEEGVMTAKDGDVLVKGAHGELYSIKNSIFYDTYDVIDAENLVDPTFNPAQDSLKEAVESLDEDGSISVTDFTDLPDGSAMCAINMPYDTLLQFARIGLTHVIHREADRVMAEHEDVS